MTPLTQALLGIGLIGGIIVGVCAPFVVARRVFGFDIFETISKWTADESAGGSPFANSQSGDGLYAITNTQPGTGLYARKPSEHSREQVLPKQQQREYLIQYGCKDPVKCSYCDSPATAND